MCSFSLYKIIHNKSKIAFRVKVFVYLYRCIMVVHGKHFRAESQIASASFACFLRIVGPRSPSQLEPTSKSTDQNRKKLLAARQMRRMQTPDWEKEVKVIWNRRMLITEISSLSFLLPFSLCAQIREIRMPSAQRRGASPPRRLDKDRAGPVCPARTATITDF